MKTEIEKLKGHTILCGYGKVGKEVARVFRNEKTSFVVIESDEKGLRQGYHRRLAVFEYERSQR